MRRRILWIWIFSALALGVPAVVPSMVPDPAGTISLFDSADNDRITDQAPGLLPAVPTLPVVLSESLEGSLSVQPAIFRTVDPFGSRAPPPPNLLSAGSNPFRQIPE